MHWQLTVHFLVQSSNEADWPLWFCIAIIVIVLTFNSLNWRQNCKNSKRKNRKAISQFRNSFFGHRIYSFEYIHGQKEPLSLVITGIITQNCYLSSNFCCRIISKKKYFNLRFVAVFLKSWRVFMQNETHKQCTRNLSTVEFNILLEVLRWSCTFIGAT